MKLEEMNEPLKVLICGTGYAGQGYTEAFRHVSVDVVGMVGRNGAIVREVANKLGSIVIIMGTAMLLMTLIPKPVWGCILFALGATTVLFIGISLKRSARSVNTQVNVQGKFYEC